MHLLQITLLGFSSIELLKMLLAAFVAIVFLQSGLDKALNYKGNLDYFKSHFSKSPLAPTVGLLLPAITLLEILAGIMAILGIVYLFTHDDSFAFYALLVAAIDLLSLLFGQRMAQDYAGAAGIVPYFVVVVLGLSLFAL